jgi:hypothetical protein
LSSNPASTFHLLFYKQRIFNPLYLSLIQHQGKEMIHDILAPGLPVVFCALIRASLLHILVSSLHIRETGSGKSFTRRALLTGYCVLMKSVIY